MKHLAEQNEIDFFASDQSQKPADIATNAVQHAKTQFHDIAIIDTAGRLHVDVEMMQEIKAIHYTASMLDKNHTCGLLQKRCNYRVSSMTFNDYVNMIDFDKDFGQCSAEELWELRKDFKILQRERIR